MVNEHHLSERRACGLVGLSRDSYRHPPELDASTRELADRIVEIAQVRRRFGYRGIHDMLRPDFPGGNHKRKKQTSGSKAACFLYRWRRRRDSNPRYGKPYTGFRAGRAAGAQPASC
jgi:putative transposase